MQKPVVAAPPSHDLSLAGKDWQDVQFNVYYYPRHQKCSTALFNFAKPLQRVDFIPLGPDTEFSYTGIPVIWGNKNESMSLIHKCWREKIDFIHFDLPYLEDWHTKHKATTIDVFRMTINGLHKNHIYPRGRDRATELMAGLDLNFTPFTPARSNKVLIIPPSETMAEFYQLDINLWIEDAIDDISRHGFDYHIRYKPKSRQHRASLIDDIRESCAMYVFNSNAGVESLIHGIPVVAAPHSAMGDMGMTLAEIRDGDHIGMSVRDWFNSIAYSQWTVKELISGEALTHTLQEYDLYAYR